MLRAFAVFAILSMLLQGCVLRSRFDAPRWASPPDAANLHQEINLSQPSVCNNYPVEYRREVPSEEGKQVIVRAGVLMNVPPRCDVRYEEGASKRRSAWWRLW